MGADNFAQTVTGCKTASEAFDYAVEQAEYAYGHAGYTGTIAEKDSFVVVTPPEGVTAKQAFQYWDLGEWGDNRFRFSVEQRIALDTIAGEFDDKWGPALAIKLDDDTWGFWGYASC